MAKYISVKEASLRWNITIRNVRYYCESQRIDGAFFDDGKWLIPDEAEKPIRKNEKLNKNYLLEKLRDEKKNKVKGGIYHQLQIDMTYNSNHIEGSSLTHNQTRYIFETGLLELDNNSNKVDDVIETVNHFKAIDRVIDFANYEISEKFIKELHYILKSGTSESRSKSNPIGEYKKDSNYVGGSETTSPLLVSKEMKNLVNKYIKKDKHTFEEIIEFHEKFESIHPFSDGNGRVGRLIAFKECLKNNIVPFIITDNIKLFYYRGLREYKYEKGYLIDTCLSGQDLVKEYLDYLNIRYKK